MISAVPSVELSWGLALISRGCPAPLTSTTPLRGGGVSLGFCSARRLIERSHSGRTTASSGRSWATQQRFPDHVLPGTFDYGFSLGLLAKDVECGLRLIDSSETEGGVGREKVLARVSEVVRKARDTLGTEVDHLEIVRMLEQDAGIVVRSPQKC